MRNNELLLQLLQVLNTKSTSMMLKSCQISWGMRCYARAFIKFVNKPHLISLDPKML